VNKRIGRAITAIALIGWGVVLGATLTSLRAQTAAPTIKGSFRHIGFVVTDVDASAAKFAGVFGAAYTPVHSIDKLVFPPDFKGDRRTAIRTTEVRTNGLEFHLLQPIGGASSWQDHLGKYGNGSLHHISFGVTDLAGTVAALKKVGGTVTVGGADSFFAYLEFPQVPFAIELEKVSP
jgi:hypothetical protein